MHRTQLVPGAMAPGHSPYQYPQMQPFSPCPPMPPMPSYPQAAATPQPGQPGSVPMHPAYQQPPQLPGAYPRSPSRLNPHRAAHVQEWMNPQITSYSPVPSVAPSVMSGMSGMYSDHGSAMSYGSILPFELPMECPTDMRSPSQISSLSGSENIDPMHVPPVPFPPQANPANLSQFLPHWKAHFLGEAFHEQIVHQMSTFLIDLETIYRKKQKGEYEQLRAQLTPLVEMVPFLIKAFGQFSQMQQHMQDPRSSYTKCCSCFQRIVKHFPEDLVAKEIAHAKGIVVIVDNLRRSWNEFLAAAVDTILGWKRPVAEKAKFRATVRGHQFFMSELMNRLRAPTTCTLLLFQLGILASLAQLTDTIKNNLSDPASDGAIIRIIFRVIIMFLGRYANERPSKTLHTIYRQIIRIVYLLLGEERESRSPERIHRQVKVAIQLLEYNGLPTICNFFHNSLTKREDGFAEICDEAGSIFRGCCLLLVEQSTLPLEAANALQEYKNMMLIQKPMGSMDLHLAQMIVTSMDILVAAKDVPCGKAHQAVAQSLFQLSQFSATVKEQFKHIVLKIAHWITHFAALKSASKERWNKMAACALDTEDTLLCVFNNILYRMNSVPDAVLPIQKIEELMQLFLSQISDFYLNEKITIYGNLSRMHVELFKRIIASIGRLVKYSESMQSGGALTRVTDPERKENTIAWLMMLIGEMQVRFKTLENNDLRKCSTDIAMEAISTLQSIWQVFDPSKLQTGTEIRSKIKMLIVHHCTPRLIEWISLIQTEKTLFNSVFPNDRLKRPFSVVYISRVLQFCLAICVEEVSAFWRDNYQGFFQELCLNQDSEINHLANQICNSFNPESTQSMFDVMSQAMDGNYYS